MPKFDIADTASYAEFLAKYPHLTDALSSGAIYLVESEVALVAYEVRPLFQTIFVHGTVVRQTGEAAEIALGQFITQEMETWKCPYLVTVSTLFDSSIKA